MKRNSKKSIQMKSTVCAVTAMLCLAQPVWGDTNTMSATESVSTSNAAEQTSEKIRSEIPDGAKISSVQAEENIKRLFPQLKKATVDNAEFTELNNVSTGVKVWELQFTLKRGNSSYGFSGSVNAITGEIVSVYLPRYVLLLSGGDAGPEISREAASQKALNWIKQNIKSVNVNDLSENKQYIGMEKTLFSPLSYDFYYNVTVNGIPSDADQIRLSMDHQGNVTSFNRQQYAASTPSSEAKISAEAARKQYEDAFVAELSYIPSIQFGVTKGPYFLGYVPNNKSNLAIDANTGSILDYTGEPVKEKQFEPIVIPASKDVFTPSSKSLASGDEAAKWVESQIEIPKGYKAVQKRLGQRWNDKESKVWNINWNDTASNAGMDISVEVDATTGKIHMYNQYQYYYGRGESQNKPSTTSISKKDAEQIAFSTISKLAPNATKEWKLVNVTEPRENTPYQNFDFSFSRYAGEISILGETLSISIGTDGKVKQYYNSSFVDFSELPLNSKPVISAEEAKAAFLKDTELKLKFAQYGGYSSSGGSAEFFTKLVYSPVRKDNDYQLYGIVLPLDATTGKWRNTVPSDYIGKEVIPANDTVGHKSKAALDKMVEYRVMLPDADLKILPDQDITTGDWYLFVARALSPSLDQNFGGNTEPYGSLLPESKYYNAVQSLLSRNWLPFEPDASFSTERKLTRDELALMLTQMLKYEKLGETITKSGEVPGISDSASIVNKGAALITMKLGLLPAIDGKFMPERVVTRAEAAEVLLGLSALVGKSDSFMNDNMW
ncbi:YcdB/YcdC domain-containing protein [Paenibacillus sp. GCM10028914]|uniref:YcdB/YcdC domain-containing protein n=1 Tax=Paenibacillus sp. GCM10028914 TaxID=3273416 RepID=UPI00360E9185